MKKKTTPRAADAAVVRLAASAHGAEPALFAAHALLDRAWARVDAGPRGALTVTLLPKPGADAAAVEAAFREELASQERRWAVARNNAPVLLHAARQAVLAAEGRLRESAPAAPASEALTAEQQSEIDRLIAEVEVEIKELKTRKEGADPDNVRATWEERHKEQG